MNTPLDYPIRALLVLATWIAFAGPVHAQGRAETWKVGVATRKLTPAGPMWMAGYANRLAPSTGVDLDIFGKALALHDTGGQRVVIVTLDLIGVPRSLRTHVERECATRFGLKPHEILLNASHTHSGPLVSPDRMELERTFSRAAKPEQVKAVNDYTPWLEKTVVELIGASLENPVAAKLEFSHARAGFAMNRRRPEANGTYSNNPYPEGPVDHDVPVLKVTGANGKLQAVLFGYACHNTTLSGSRISGDYAGYAQHDLETSFPGATALFMMGCAGDQNPYPRGNTMVPDQPTEELVKHHGRALANAVATALGARQRSVAGPLRSALAYANLDYEPLSQERLAAFRPLEHTPPVIARAQALMQKLQRGERLDPYDCPVQVLRFGTDLTLVAIGGEVVVDYALRLKSELKGPAAVWVAGYSNDIFGYLGSRRVIEEGGYEGIEANVRILNHPGRFTLDAEDRIVAKVHELHMQTQR